MLPYKTVRQPSRSGNTRTASKPALPRKPVAKKEWCITNTDLDKLKATKEEILYKKSLMVSSHNMFVDGTDGSMGSRRIISRYPSRTLTAASSMSTPQKTGKVATSNKNIKDFNALDLLSSDVEREIKRGDGLLNKVASRKTSTSFKASKGRSPASTSKIAHNEIDSENVEVACKTEHDTLSGFQSNMTIDNWLAYSGTNAISVDRADAEQAAPSDQQTPVKRSMRREGSGKSSPAGFQTSSLGGLNRKSAKSPAKSPSYAKSPHPSSSTPATAGRGGAGGEPKDADLVYIADEIRSLFGELKYYEELSGRRSILDTREVCYSPLLCLCYVGCCFVLFCLLLFCLPGLNSFCFFVCCVFVHLGVGNNVE
jgi:hypothetical protein